jgi:hypothetical protein
MRPRHVSWYTAEGNLRMIGKEIGSSLSQIHPAWLSRAQAQAAPQRGIAIFVERSPGHRTPSRLRAEEARLLQRPRRTRVDVE